MSRRKSRIIAFQALYSWNVSRVPTEELLTFSWLKKDSEFTPNELEEQTFASFIISGTIDHLDEIKEFQKIFMEVVADIRERNMFTYPVKLIAA